VPTNDGEPPKFSSNGATLHLRIREKCSKFLTQIQTMIFLTNCCDEIEILRKDFLFSKYLICILTVLILTERNLATIHFCRTRINRTMLHFKYCRNKKFLMRENPSVYFISRFLKKN
jgi:hypothetical protein